MVKVRYGFIKLPCREVAEQPLKLAERFRRIVNMIQVLHHLVGSRPLYENIGSPVVTIRRPVESTFTYRGNEIQRFSFWIATGCDDLLPQMGRHLFDVVHKLFWALEDMMVYPLKNVAVDRTVPFSKTSNVRVVDVSKFPEVGF